MVARMKQGTHTDPLAADRSIRAAVDACIDPSRGTIVGMAYEAVYALVKERNAALAVLRAVYQESTAIHAAYKALPEALRAEVEGRPPPKTGKALLCAEHGGYGFSSDCEECRNFEARR